MRIFGRRGLLLISALVMVAAPLVATTAQAAARPRHFDDVRNAAGGKACSLPVTSVNRVQYLSRNSQVIANRHFRVTGSAYFAVYGSNVTFRNVCIDTFADGAIRPQTKSRALRLVDVTVRGQNVLGGAGNCGTGVWLPAGSSALRVVSTGCEDGFLLGDGATLSDSWCYGLVPRTNPAGHDDCIQSTAGSNITIRHNALDGPWRGQTSGILIKSDQGPISNVIIDNNYISGGSYTVYVLPGGYPMPTNVRLTNNRLRMNSARYGPCSYGRPRPISVRTVWDHNGAPAPC
ncbi:MAG: hypothetical protein ABI912_09260 [Actinomycetota bacterium]